MKERIQKIISYFLILLTVLVIINLLITLNKNFTEFSEGFIQLLDNFTQSTLKNDEIILQEMNRLSQELSQDLDKNANQVSSEEQKYSLNYLKDQLKTKGFL